MPAPKKFSNYTRQEKAEIQDKETGGGWNLDLISLMFIFTAFMFIMQTMLSYQNNIEATAPYLYQAAILLGGLSIGIPVASNVGGVKMKKPERTEYIKFLMFTLILFLGMLIINGVIGSAFSAVDINKIFYAQSPVAGLFITTFIAAVAEETVFCLAFALILFKALTYISTGLGGFGVVQQYIALFLAAIINGALFWAIHLYVYGTEPGIAVMLFVNRIVYTFVFYITRDLKYPMALHILHNAMVAF